MKKIYLLLYFIPFFCRAQTDVLELKKNGTNFRTYSPGMYLAMETIYDQWFEGPITAIRNDSVFVNGLAFHYKEVKTIRFERTKLNYKSDGLILMIAGGGVLLLGAVNGMYRGDPVGEWYTPASYITAGALLGLGFLLIKSQYKKYKLGKKYKLEYLSVVSNKKDQRPF